MAAPAPPKPVKSAGTLAAAHPLVKYDDYGAVPEAGGTAFRVWAPACTAVFVTGSWDGWHALWQLDPEMVGTSVSHTHSGFIRGCGVGHEYRYKARMALASAGRPMETKDFWMNDACGRQIRVRGRFTGIDSTNEVVTRRAAWPVPGSKEFSAAALPAIPHVTVHPAAAVVYELHLTGLSEAGTWLGAIARLPYLAALGVNVLEVMPVTLHTGLGKDDGLRDWGYGPLSQSHLHPPHGSPEDCRAFIAAAHAHGMAVILDIVPNHMSGGLLMAIDKALCAKLNEEGPARPAGTLRGPLHGPARHISLADLLGTSEVSEIGRAMLSSLSRSVSGKTYPKTGPGSRKGVPPEVDLAGKSYFYADTRFDTPWGGGRLDLSRPHVRNWLTRLTLMWVVEYGFDGFRVDSIETLVHEAGTDMGRWDRSPSAMLPEAWAWMSEMCESVRAVFPGALIIAEQLHCDPRTFAVGFDADWTDWPLREIRRGLEEDGARGRPRHPLFHVGKALQGDMGSGVAPWSRCVFLGSHDTQGSERSGSLAAAFRRVGHNEEGVLNCCVAGHALLTLACRGLPMITMGEEVLADSSEPFPAPPSLPPLPPLGSLSFRALVAFGALNRVRRLLPALRGSWMSIPHINDGGECRVMTVLRAGEEEGKRGDAAAPLLLSGVHTHGEDVVIIANLGWTDYHTGYTVPVHKGGRWGCILNTHTLLWGALPLCVAYYEGATDGVAAQLADGLLGLEPQGPADLCDWTRSVVVPDVTRLLRGPDADTPWLFGPVVHAAPRPMDNFMFSLDCPHLPPFSVAIYAKLA